MSIISALFLQTGTYVFEFVYNDCGFVLFNKV